MNNRIKVRIIIDNARKHKVFEENHAIIKELELRPESLTLLEGDLSKRWEAKRVMHEKHRIMTLDARQKSRVRWAIEGDENTKFFHGIMKLYISKNRACGLILEDEWVTNSNVLKDKVTEFFSTNFTKPILNRPGFVCPGLARLSDDRGGGSVLGGGNRKGGMGVCE